MFGCVLDEWNNFLQRLGLESSSDPEDDIFRNEELEDKLREWASFRGQTLSRTGAVFCVVPRKVWI